MDQIDQHLATVALDKKYVPAVQAAVMLGKNLLNKYYDLTDSSEIYRIAMSGFLLASSKSRLTVIFQSYTLLIKQRILLLLAGKMNG
jgi:hypothetical protein